MSNVHRGTPHLLHPPLHMTDWPQPCQSLFVAPCSHVWHFKCIRPILTDSKNYPQFLCPNCRAVADLEADIDDPAGAWHEGEDSNSDVEKHEAAEEEAMAQAIAASLEHMHISGGDPLSANRGVPGPGLLQAQAVEPAAEGQDATPISRSETAERGAVVRGRDHISLPEPMQSPSFASAVGAAVPLSLGAVELPASPNARERPITPGAPEQQEGPLTPRNDAGPFVFDGSAGQLAGEAQASSSS